MRDPLLLQVITLITCLSLYVLSLFRNSVLSISFIVWIIIPYYLKINKRLECNPKIMMEG